MHVFRCDGRRSLCLLVEDLPDREMFACQPKFRVDDFVLSGGEYTEYKVQDGQGDVIEVITTFINKDRDQWATVVLRRNTKGIFCLYASGIGRGSVDRRTIK